MFLFPAILTTVTHYFLACHRNPLTISNLFKTLQLGCSQKPRNMMVRAIMASLHWEPVVFRIDFKILLLVFKSLNSLAPSYITDFLTPYTLPRTLRSADQLLLMVPRTRLVTEDNRAFAVRAPKLWNTLP